MGKGDSPGFDESKVIQNIPETVIVMGDCSSGVDQFSLLGRL